MNKEELDTEILALEKAWNKHHKDPKNYRMPDMVRLAKLRIARRNLDANL